MDDGTYDVRVISDGKHDGREGGRGLANANGRKRDMASHLRLGIPNPLLPMMESFSTVRHAPNSVAVSPPPCIVAPKPLTCASRRAVHLSIRANPLHFMDRGGAEDSGRGVAGQAQPARHAPAAHHRLPGWHVPSGGHLRAQGRP